MPRDRLIHKIPMINPMTKARSGGFPTDCMTTLTMVMIACCAACRPSDEPGTQAAPAPAIARIDSFAENELRLDLIASDAKALEISVGYRLKNLPAVRDIMDSLAGIRDKRGSPQDYRLGFQGPKPAGRKHQSQAHRALTTWPPNASDDVRYMLTVLLPENCNTIWQIFLVNPGTGKISLIRDRRTGDTIPLRDWLRFEERTAVYTLDEIARGWTEPLQDQAPRRSPDDG